MFEIHDATDIFFAVALLLGVVLLAVGFLFSFSFVVLCGIGLFALGMGYFLGMYLVKS